MRRRLEVGAVLLLVGLYVAVQWYCASHLPLDFDSSYNLLISRTVAKSGRYATDNFLLPSQEYFPFDAWITTGYPVLLLTGGVWSLFGTGEGIARALMIGWGGGFLLLSTLFVRRLQPSFPPVILGGYLLVLFYLLGMHHLAVHTLGELPAGVFLVAGLLLYRSTHWGAPFLLGLVLGLAGLTKLMTVFGAAPLGLAYVAGLLQRRRWGAASAACLGGLLPFLFQAGGIAVQMPLQEWWGYQQLVWKTQGAGLDLSAFSGVAPLLARIRGIGGRDPVFLIGGALLVHLVATYRPYRRPELVAILSLLFFFVMLQTGDNPRHLVLSKFLILSLLGPAMVELYGEYGSLRRWVVRATAALVLVVLGIQAGRVVREGIPPTEAGKGQRRFARYVQHRLPRARIFFPGWWKAPDIQILSGRRFVLADPKNMHLCLSDCFLIVDPLMQSLAPQDVAGVEREYGAPAVVRDGYRLYRIPPPRAGAPSSRS